MGELRLGSASCLLSGRGPNRYIYCLLTRPNARKQGHAKRLLRAIRKWSERTGTTVGLHIGPFSDRPMDRDQLLKFYSQMGFKLADHDEMWLTPRKVKK